MNMNTTARKYRDENLISDALSRDIRHCHGANEWVCGGDAMNSALWPSEALALTWVNAQCAARQTMARLSSHFHTKRADLTFSGRDFWRETWLRPNLVGRLWLQQLIQKFVKLKLMTYWKSYLKFHHQSKSLFQNKGLRGSKCGLNWFCTQDWNENVQKLLAKFMH